MSDTEAISLAYTPTEAEIMRGTQLLCKPLYRGRWRAAVMIYAAWQGIGLGIGTLVISYLLARLFGPVPGEAAPLMYLFFVILSVTLWQLERRIKRRGAAVYRLSPLMQDQQVTINDKGIFFDNGRSTTFYNWRDINGMLDAPDMIIASMDYQGIILPDRILAPLDDAAVLRAKIKGWHAAAQGTQ